MCYLLLQLRASILWAPRTALKVHEDDNFLVHLWSKHNGRSALWNIWNEHSFNCCIHSCSCRTLCFLLATKKVSGPAPTAIRQQHVKLHGYVLCSNICWLVINKDNIRQSQYLWTLKHKTNSTRTTIHQSNPSKLKKNPRMYYMSFENFQYKKKYRTYI